MRVHPVLRGLAVETSVSRVSRSVEYHPEEYHYGANTAESHDSLAVCWVSVLVKLLLLPVRRWVTAVTACVGTR